MKQYLLEKLDAKTQTWIAAFDPEICTFYSLDIAQTTLSQIIRIQELEDDFEEKAWRIRVLEK